MRKQRITDHDASALLQGRTPDERPDLAPIAESVAHFRAAAFEAAPRPSAELLSRISASTPALAAATSASPSGEVSSQGRVKKNMFASIAGLGLATKLVLGISVAAVAGVAGAGAAGVLPTQQPSEIPMPTPETTSTAEPTAAPTWSADEYKNFGKWVSLRAHDKDSVVGPFGKMISEAAHQKNQDKRDAVDEQQTGKTDQQTGKPDHETGKPDNPGQGHKPDKNN
jgi:hypothetical protein